MVRRPYSVSIDPIADASLQTHQATLGSTATHCDICGAAIEGEPAGHGLYMWKRGEERRVEEPALCSNCSGRIGVSALSVWRVEEEG
jgi:hypothetical protein